MTKRQMTRVLSLKDEAYAAGDNETAGLCAEALDGDEYSLARLATQLKETKEAAKLVGRPVRSSWGQRQSIPTHPWAHDEE